MKSRPRRVLRDAHHSPPCLQLSSHRGGGVISDSAERLSCTEGGTGSRNKPGLIDSEVAAAPPPLTPSVVIPRWNFKASWINSAASLSRVALAKVTQAALVKAALAMMRSRPPSANWL